MAAIGSLIGTAIAVTIIGMFLYRHSMTSRWAAAAEVVFYVWLATAFFATMAAIS